MSRATRDQEDSREPPKPGRAYSLRLTPQQVIDRLRRTNLTWDLGRRHWPRRYVKGSIDTWGIFVTLSAQRCRATAAAMVFELTPTKQGCRLAFEPSLRSLWRFDELARPLLWGVGGLMMSISLLTDGEGWVDMGWAVLWGAPALFLLAECLRKWRVTRDDQDLLYRVLVDAVWEAVGSEQIEEQGSGYRAPAASA